MCFDFSSSNFNVEGGGIILSTTAAGEALIIIIIIIIITLAILQNTQVSFKSKK